MYEFVLDHRIQLIANSGISQVLDKILDRNSSSCINKHKRRHWSVHFLSRVGILTRDIDIGILSVRLSVRLFVRP